MLFRSAVIGIVAPVVVGIVIPTAVVVISTATASAISPSGITATVVVLIATRVIRVGVRMTVAVVPALLLIPLLRGFTVCVIVIISLFHELDNISKGVIGGFTMEIIKPGAPWLWHRIKEGFF